MMNSQDVKSISDAHIRYTQQILPLALVFLVILGSVTPSMAQDPGWPREYDSPNHRVILYQPQVDSWQDNKLLNFVAAVELAPKVQGKSVYGVLEAAADTATNVAARTVTLSNLRVTDLRFPNVEPADAEKNAALVKAALPSTQGKTMEVSLDRVLAVIEQAPGEQPAVEVNLDPPKIFYSDKPAILVIFMGKPKFEKVPDTNLMAAVNTNWDLFMDPAASRYYLLNDEFWLTSDDPDSTVWQPVKELPQDLNNLPADANWEEVKKHVPGITSGTAPAVFVSTEPAEMIITDGKPAFSPIPGTKLMEVTNSESVLFYRGADEDYYLLVAGRWFKAKALEGPWAAASSDLPPDFAMIPDDSEKAFVKASVPGTEDAEDAVLLASVPQKTVVKKSEAVCEVTYDGAPRFESIKGTTVEYAINSPNDVFLVNGGFYCCNQGMWFAAPKPEGPWVICTTVPEELYTIPANHPKHNVTYVYVYDSTPETVEVGYTSGYSGEYVAATGVLMFGLGMVVGAALADDWDDDCWYWHYSYGCHGSYYSYGCGAVYHHGYGGYYRSAHYYGPYGGAGRAGYYNPSTGGWARGGYVYGPRGGAGAVAGYNPFTDTYAARAAVKTPYGSSGRFYAERGNDAVWGGHESGARGSVGWAQGSEGAGIIHKDTITGQGTVARDKEGNVYVGKDGNVYKHEEGGGWSKNQGGDWKPVERGQAGTTSAASNARTSAGATGRTLPGQTQPRGTTGAVRQPSTTGGAPTARTGTAGTVNRSPASSDFRQQLDRDASARARGELNASRASSGSLSSRSGSLGGASRSGAATRSGGGARSGGGGRRR